MKSFFLGDGFRIDRPGLFGQRGASSGAVPPWVPLSLSDRTVVSGHSLGDILFMWGNDYRGMMPRLMESSGVPGDTTQVIRKATIPGSLVKARWEVEPGVAIPTADNPRYSIADYQLMIIMDGGPLAAVYSDERVQEDQLKEDLTYLKLFVDNAHANGDGGAGAKVLYYTIWPFLNGYRGLSFRDGIDAYEANSHYRVDWLMRETGRYIHIIPGHRVMARMWDDFQDGLLPGVTDWAADIYMPEDPDGQEIHPNGLATYPIACLTHAIMYGESPIGLSYDWVTGPAITAEQALYFQTIAWEIATTYARAGLGGTDMGLVGLRVAPQQTPRQTLGNRLIAAVDFATGTAGPVTTIEGDGITLTTEIGTPVRMEGFVRFEDATMGGALDVPPGRYVARLMRMNSQRNEHYDVGVLFTNGQYGWGSPGGYVAMNEGTNGTYLEASSGMPEGIFRNRNMGEWALVEGWWLPDQSAMRIEGIHPLATAAGTDLPPTSRLTIGGPLSDTHLPPNLDMAGLVVASEVPTLEERDAIIRWLRERLEVTPHYWTPADEIAGGNYAWEWSAKTPPTTPGGVTTLLDANGGPITLTAKDDLVGSQPAYMTDGTDGLPFIRNNVNNAAKRIQFLTTLELHAESFFYLARPTFTDGAAQAIFALGNNSNGFHVDALVSGEFQARITGAGAFRYAVPATPVNWLNTWITGVIELDPIAGELRHYINGSLYASAAYIAPVPFTVDRFAIFSNWSLSGSAQGNFAHGFFLHSVGPETRARGIDYLKREWGSRVVGW